MDYSIKNKKIDLNKANVIGFGKNGNVYKYENMVIKIFPKGKIPDGLIDGKVCRNLSNISTYVILLPLDSVLFKNKKFSGYNLKPLNNNKTKNIAKMEKSDLITCIEYIEDDVLTLSNNGVLLDGILPENVIVSDKIYLSDPSKYSFVESNNGLYDFNSYQVHLLLSKLVLSGLKKCDITTTELKKLKEKLLEKKDNESSSEFFNNLIGDNNNIYSYVKKRR